MLSTLPESEFHPKVQVQAFGDDLTILICGKSCREIENIANETSNQIEEPEKIRQLEFNPNKFSFLIIGKKYERTPTTD